MELGLQGLNAVVTGSSRGIGRAIARAFVAEGVNVLVCGRSGTAEQTAEALRQEAAEFARVESIAVDLTHRDAVEEIAHAIDRHFGRLDILVNCAGGEPFGSLDDFDEEIWKQAADLKLWGYVKMTKLAFDVMRRHGTAGSIINITGSGGTLPQAWYPAGAIVCGALNAFTRSVAHQGAAWGIRVNAISPHYIATERLDSGFAAPAQAGVPTLADMQGAVGARRMGTVDEVADLAAFLVSRRSTFTSGAIVSVDGGTLGLMGTNDTDWSQISSVQFPEKDTELS